MPPKKQTKVQPKAKSPSPQKPQRASRQKIKADAKAQVKQKSPSPPPQKKAPATKKKVPVKAKSPSPQRSSKRKAAPKAKSPSPQKVQVTQVKDEPKKEVKLIIKGGAAVDQFVPGKEKFRVFNSGSTIYSTTLNQSNLSHNNNKFYILQILQNESNPNQYYFFTRWGRVGVPGQQALQGPIDQNRAISEYEKKKRDKKREYTEIFINYGDDEENEPKKEKSSARAKASQPKSESKLHERVKSLMNMIFDLKMIETTMKEIGYDAKKMPLGKLSDQTVKEGFQVLSEIQKAVKEKKNKETLNNLSSQFYSLIPHDFGFQKMHQFVLDSEEKVRDKLNMLQTLTDLKITTKILKGSESDDSQEDIVDQNYKKLHCKINPLDKSDERFKLICQYIEDGKENFKPVVMDIFELDREGENERYDTTIGNDMMLWHGSRVSNFGGILSQGLRIAPPEAPASGYNYGKGIYFADIFGKSACYCRGGTSNNEILIMVVKTAVGNPNVLQATDYNASNLPKGTHSTFGWGKNGPPEKDWKQLDGCKLPLGKPQATKSKNYMGHNEYIVYSLKQAQLKYLIRAKLN